MLSLETAQRLKQAGLEWSPGLLDFFVIPERNLDDKIFVISDMLVTLEVLGGLQIVSFQGASEWALDYLLAADAVWLPREDQLRSTLEELLLEIGSPDVHLYCSITGYSCTIKTREEVKTFAADDPCEAYAAAMNHLLKSRSKRG